MKIKCSNLSPSLVFALFFTLAVALGTSCSSTQEKEVLEDVESEDELLQEEQEDQSSDIDESAGIIIEEDEVLAAEDYDYSESLASTPSPQEQVSSKLEQLDQEFEDQGPVLPAGSAYAMDTPATPYSQNSSEYRVYYVKRSTKAYNAQKSPLASTFVAGDRVLAKMHSNGWLEGQDGQLYKSSELSTSVVGRKRSALGWNG